MLGPEKRYFSSDRYPVLLAGIQIVLLITAVFYSLVLVRETAAVHIGNYKSQAVVFSEIQGWSKSEESLKKFERERIKIQRILAYFSDDFINAILNYFWLIPSQTIDDFVNQGSEVVLAIDEYEELFKKLIIHYRATEIEEQLIFEEVDKLVYQLIDMQSTSNQIVAVQRKRSFVIEVN